jgi:hypothetical protein
MTSESSNFFEYFLPDEVKRLYGGVPPSMSNISSSQSPRSPLCGRPLIGEIASWPSSPHQGAYLLDCGPTGGTPRWRYIPDQETFEQLFLWTRVQKLPSSCGIGEGEDIPVGSFLAQGPGADSVFFIDGGYRRPIATCFPMVGTWSWRMVNRKYLNPPDPTSAVNQFGFNLDRVRNWSWEAIDRFLVGHAVADVIAQEAVA